MKVVLADIRPARKIVCNKDLSGGFGTSSDFGSSLAMKFIKFLKGKNINIPLLSLGCLSGIFSGKGFCVELVRDVSQLGEADLVLVHTSLIAHAEELAFAKIARQHSKVGFTGPLASVRPQLFLKHGDFVIAGEPESWALDFNASELSTLSGIIESPMVLELDKLPFPNWLPFQYETFSYGIYLKNKPIFPVQSSRGCPLSCKYYCPYTVVSNGAYRARSVENTLEEIKYLQERYGAKGIIFRDPTFTINRKRVINFCEKILDSGLCIDWACETNLSNLDYELIDLMRAAGLKGINVGVETADEAVIKQTHRHSAAAGRISELIDYCEGNGVKTGAFYILGAPQDTADTISRTLEFSQAVNSSYAQFTICTPYPGTKFYDDVSDKIYEKEWEKFDLYTPVFHHGNLTPEQLKHFREKAFLNYYFRPGYISARLKRWFVHDFLNGSHRVSWEKGIDGVNRKKPIRQMSCEKQVTPCH